MTLCMWADARADANLWLVKRKKITKDVGGHFPSC